MKSSKLQHYVGVIILTSTLLAAACGDHKGSELNKNESCKAMVGDLVITEIMANPKGKDSGHEWFEIYNASSSKQILTGLILRQEYGQNDKVKTKEHKVKGSLTLNPGAYFVFGDNSTDFVNYNYGSGLADWNNNSAILTILCEGTVIDSINYGTADGLPVPTEGVAIAFDGSRKPDAQANNDPAAWCKALDSYDGGDNLGTPGSVNQSCTVLSCVNSGSRVNAIVPAAGDLVITEIMADPAGSDSAKITEPADSGTELIEIKLDKREYIELYNASDKDLDLYGLYFKQIKDGATDGTAHQILALGETVKNRKECIRLQAGSYILIGMSEDEDRNCDLHPDALFTGSNLNNSSGSFKLYTADGLLIDTAPYVQKKDSVYILHPNYLDAQGNDDPTHWCSIRGEDLCEDSGSPGRANNVCQTNTDSSSDNVVITCEGAAPMTGDLVISEIYSAPGPNSDQEFSKEFVEVYATKAVTTNSMTLISKSLSTSASALRKFTIDFGECYTFEAGKYVTFGGSTDENENEGIAVDFAYTGTSKGLYQPKTGFLIELLNGTTLIDSAPNAMGGALKSANLSADKLNAVDNDDSANWCLADLTPGQAAGICSNEGPDTDDCDTEKAPISGDIAITEIYSAPGPKAGEEFNKEFVEVFVARTIEVKSLTILSKTASASGSPRTFTVNFGECKTIQAGDYLAFGGSADKELNGNIDIDYVYTGPSSGLNQPTKNYTIELLHKGTLIDSAPNTKGKEGKSANFNTASGYDFASLNDDAANWCEADPTPGGVNNACQ